MKTTIHGIIPTLAFIVLVALTSFMFTGNQLWYGLFLGIAITSMLVGRLRLDISRAYKIKLEESLKGMRGVDKVRTSFFNRAKWIGEYKGKMFSVSAIKMAGLVGGIQLVYHYNERPKGKPKHKSLYLDSTEFIIYRPLRLYYRIYGGRRSYNKMAVLFDKIGAGEL